MTRRVRPTLFIASGVLLACASSVNAQQVYTLKPPTEIETLLIKLERGDDRGRDIRALGDRDHAALYIRNELIKAEGRYQRDLTEALQRLEIRMLERNHKRFAWWAKCR
jgi:hypothetical protein